MRDARTHATAIAVATAAAAAAAVFACGSEVTVETRFETEAVRSSVTELEIYIFETGDCAPFDPHGAPFVDAATRANQPALFTQKVRRDEAVEAFPDLGPKTYALVIDGYGPSCKKVLHEGGENSCTEFDNASTRIHRTHACITFDGATDKGRTLALTSIPTAPIGSQLNVEEIELEHWNSDKPLPVMEGFVARQPFVMQLVDENSELLNGALVHWRVSKGSGFMEEVQPVLSRPGKFDTSNQTDVAADGLSFGTLHAGAEAAGDNGGRIVVEAYTPGFERSPAVFEAVALPRAEVEVEVQDFRIDPGMIDLSTLTSIRPVLVRDVDQDGFLDVIISSYERGNCNTDRTHHRVAVLFGDASGGMGHPVISDSAEGLLYSMVYSKSDSGGEHRLIAFTADPCSDALEATPDGNQYRAKDIAVEAWALGRDGVANAGRLTNEISAVAPNPTLTIEKIAVSADAADLDPSDGVEEIAVSRCSYSETGGFPINCQASIQKHHDSEIAVLRPSFDNGTLTGVRVVARIDARDTMAGAKPGSFGEVRFVDLDGDQLPDISWTRPNLVLGICAQNFPETGYELGNPLRIFQHTANLAWGFSIGAGHFTDAPGLDVVVSGGARASGRVSGATLLESTGCSFSDTASDVVVGERVDNVDGVLVRVADLNGDGRDDAVVLHRSLGELHAYIGSGTLELAAGPIVELDAGGTAGFDLGVEGEGATRKIVAVTYAPRENRLLITKFHGRVLR